MRRGNEPAWRPLFRALRAGPVPDIWEAAKTLANITGGGTPKSLLPLQLRGGTDGLAHNP